MLLAPVIWVLTILIVYFFAAKTWWFPPPINQHGIAYDAQFMRTLVVVGIIFFLAQMILGYAIVKFRDDGGRAGYSHGNNTMEKIWTTATAVLFLGLVLMGAKDRDFKDPEEEATFVAQSLRGTYQMLTEAGHYPHAELPEVAVPIVLDFVKKVQETKEGAHAS